MLQIPCNFSAKPNLERNTAINFNCGLYNIMLSSQVTWPILTISANKNHHLRAHNLPIIYLYLVMRYSLL